MCCHIHKKDKQTYFCDLHRCHFFFFFFKGCKGMTSTSVSTVSDSFITSEFLLHNDLGVVVAL